MLTPADPRNLIPRDKHDHERATAVIGAGYPAVKPILWELLEWIQDMNWPIARQIAPFLASIGAPLIPHIEKVFETDDEIWKYWIMNEILLEAPTIAEHFRNELVRIAYSPTENEELEELPRTAAFVLHYYGWDVRN